MTAVLAGVNAGCTDHPAVASHFSRALHEALAVPRDWATSYGEFQSGGWRTLSLVNTSGDPADTVISANPSPVRTSLLERMPAMAALLGELGLDIWWARLALMEPGACLWPHVDYTEPGVENTERSRVHLPLVTSSAAYLVTAGHRVHMAAGRLWRITPTSAHGAVNVSGPARLHLLLDCHDSPALAAMREAETLPPSSLRPLAAATADELQQAARTAGDLAWLGWPEQAEQLLLRLYFTRRLPGDGHVYDMIIAMHAARGDDAAAAAWRDRKRITLGAAQ
jgi:hypothetical protein